MSELPVALDAMGADEGPRPSVEGAVAAVREDGARVILTGDEPALYKHIEALGAKALVDAGTLLVRHAPDVVLMDDKPVVAARKKKDSSMRRACDLVDAGEACGALSAGNSGAMLAVSLLVFGRIEGVRRPAIATLLPAQSDIGRVLLVDAGANTDCGANHLAQWAVLGSEYIKRTFHVAHPKVGILSNGEEDSKGTELTRQALAYVRQLPVALHGYVEGRDLNSGLVHVIVTDGFTGNVTLKTAEGVFKFVIGQIREGYERGGVVDKIGGALSKGMFERMRQKLDPREFGAAPLLGLAKPAFIAHGSSDAYSIRRGIGAVRAYANNDIVKHLEAAAATTVSVLAHAREADAS